MFRWVLFSILFLSITSTSYVQAQSFWESTGGPPGGTVFALSFNSTGDLLAGTGGTGVFARLAADSTWVVANAGLGNLDVYTLLGLSNGAVVAGTGQGVFRSADGAQNWNATNLDFGTNASLTSRSATDLFVGTISSNAGVLRSIDGGLTWGQPGLFGYSVSALVYRPSSNTLFAGSPANGVFRSTDAGLSWVQVNNGLSDTLVLSLALNSSGHLFAGTGSGVFRSTNDGASWSSVSAGLSNSPKYALAINAAGHVYVSAAAQGVFRSTNNGSSWNPVNAGLTNLDVRSFVFSPGGVLYAGTGNGTVFGSKGTTIPPIAPVLTFPADSAANQLVNIQLRWNASPQAVDYRLQVSTDPQFTTTIVDDTALTVTIRMVGPLSNGTSYFWRVSARNLGGPSAYTTRTFTTVSAGPTTLTWIGLVSNDWFDPNNWNPSLVPTSDDTVIINSGTPSLDAAATVGGVALTGGTLTGAGTLNVTGSLNWTGGGMGGGGATVITPGGSLLIGASNVGLTGRTIINHGTTAWSGFAAIQSFSGTNTLSNEPGGLFLAQNNSAMQVIGTGSITFTNKAGGVITKSVSGSSTNIAVAFTNAGTVNILSGLFQCTVFNYSQAAGITHLGGGTLSSGSGIDIQGGVLDGTGSITGSLSNAGVINPGSPTGKLSITGNYTQTATGILNIDIAGITPALEFDQLTISDSATLGGTLNVSLVSPYLPSEGNTFQLMTFGSHGGGFSTINGLNIGSGLAFTPILNAADFTLRTIGSPPVPTLFSPPDGATNLSVPVTLLWNTSAGAISYRLQLATDSMFNNTDIDDSTLADTTYQVTDLFEATTYYWRVSATNSLGTSALSTPFQFRTAGVPNIQLNPSFVDFGDVSSGSTASNTATILSTGTDPLVVDSVRIIGADASEFAVFGSQGPFPPVNPSDSIHIVVQFIPITAGSKTASLVIWSNTSPGFDSIALAGRSAAPALRVTINGLPITNGTVGIGVSIPVGAIAATESLYVRNAGQTVYGAFQLVGVTADSFFALIPSSYLNLRGVEYYVAIIDNQGFPFTFPELNPATNPAILRVGIVNAQSSFSLPAQQYKMVSVPLELQRPQTFGLLTDDFGPYQRNFWRLFHWESGVYVEHPQIVATTIPGNAAWIITHAGGLFDTDSGRSVLSSSPYVITLPPNDWAQVANPFAFRVDWQAITKSGSVKGPYYFDGTGYVLDTTAALVPWEGYFVFNDEVFPVTLTVPVLEASPLNAPSRQVTAAGDCAIGFSTHGGSNGPRSETYLGFKMGATGQYDGFDYPAPPPSPEGNIRLLTMDGGRECMMNFKPPAQQGASWELKITSSEHASHVNVHAGIIGELPLEHHVFVYDIQDGRIVARDGGNFVVDDLFGSRTMKVIVGTTEYAKQVLGDIPLQPIEFALQQNYPNPFNPQTTIRYQVARRSHVLMEVFNMLGQRVRLLVNEEQPVGFHSIVWDGCSDAGLVSGSGVYLYRMIAGEFSESHKLILVR